MKSTRTSSHARPRFLNSMCGRRTGPHTGETNLVQFFKAYLISNVKILQVVDGHFQYIARWPGGAVGRPPAARQAGIDDLTGRVDPYYRQVDPHEQHVNGRIHLTIMALYQQQTLTCWHTATKHQATQLAPEGNAITCPDGAAARLADICNEHLPGHRAFSNVPATLFRC